MNYSPDVPNPIPTGRVNMARTISFFALLSLFSSPLFALDWQFPIKLGDSPQQVREIFAAPSHQSKTELWYAPSGFAVNLDNRRSVTSIEFKGNYGRPNWDRCEKKIFNDLTPGSPLTDFIKSLGQPGMIFEDIDFEPKATITTSDLLPPADDKPSKPVYREYVWHIDGMSLHIDAWIVDYEYDNVNYPKGSVRRVVIRKRR